MYHSGQKSGVYGIWNEGNCWIFRCLKKSKKETCWQLLDLACVPLRYLLFFVMYIFKGCECNMVAVSKSGLQCWWCQLMKFLWLDMKLAAHSATTILCFQLSFLCYWKLVVVTFARFWNIKSVIENFLYNLVAGAKVCSRSFCHIGILSNMQFSC
jgi:hypothetical protein